MSEPERTAVRLNVDDVGKIPSMVESYLKGSNPLDLVLLQLDSEKFPRRTMDFPEDVRKYVMTHPRVKVEWNNLALDGICCDWCLNIKDTQKIVVTFTSWKKRIGNCVKVLQSILDNTVKPNIVFLNLSTEEFPDKEQDLPQDLVKMKDTNPEFLINWVDGLNTKTMKKVFPILKYLNDEDIIIWTDDDILFSKDLIQSRIYDAVKDGGFHPVFGTNTNKSIRRSFFGLDKGWMCSTAVSMCKKKMLNGYEIFSDHFHELVKDDQIYSYLIFLNGYQAKPCSQYAVWSKDGKSQLKWFNPVCGMSERMAKSDYNNLNPKEDKIVLDIFKKCDPNTFSTNYLSRIREQSVKRIAIYTYCTNNKYGKKYQNIKYSCENIDYFMFVDDKRTNETTRNGWTCINIQPKEGYSINDMNKWYKWHPQLVIPNAEQYDYIMYVDSKVEIMENPNTIINSMMNNIPLGVCCHIYNYRAPSAMDNATCLYKHLDYLINFPAGIPEKLKQWKDRLKMLGFPQGEKTAETAVVITDMSNPLGIDIQSDIFELYKLAGTHRDQVVVPVVLRNRGYAIGQFCTLGNYLTYEDELGTSFFRNNFKFNITTRAKP